MKKMTALLLGLCLLFGFAACSETTQTTAGGTTAAETASAAATDAAAPDGTTAAAAPGETETQQETAPGETQGSTAAQKAPGTTAKNKNQTTTRAAAGGTTAKQTTENQTLRCTVAIECTEILHHTDELDKSAARHLPDNGILLVETAVTVENGASVYDAVAAACQKSGLAISAERSIYGTYIKGFGGINEKCCGSGSGWLYFVNGKSPSVSCSAQKVSDGDVIEFRFTCG